MLWTRLYANVGSIVGLAPMTLYFIRIFVDYDLSLIADFTYMYLGMICLLMSYFTRYLINQLEHITGLYYSSDSGIRPITLLLR